jgi:hypothetical protein
MTRIENADETFPTEHTNKKTQIVKTTYTNISDIKSNGSEILKDFKEIPDRRLNFITYKAICLPYSLKSLGSSLMHALNKAKKEHIFESEFIHTSLVNL